MIALPCYISGKKKTVSRVNIEKTCGSLRVRKMHYEKREFLGLKGWSASCKMVKVVAFALGETD